MTPEVAAVVAAALYTAAGRKTGEAEDLVWARALADTPEDGYGDVVDMILRTQDLGAPGRGVPTPALFLATRNEWVRAGARAEERQPALLPPPPEDGPAQVARMRELLAALPAVVRRAPEVEVARQRPARPAPTMCPHDDHSRCGQGPIRIATAGEDER